MERGGGLFGAWLVVEILSCKWFLGHFCYSLTAPLFLELALRSRVVFQGCQSMRAFRVQKDMAQQAGVSTTTL